MSWEKYAYVVKIMFSRMKNYKAGLNAITAEPPEQPLCMRDKK
jgi:hypothetical protein